MKLKTITLLLITSTVFNACTKSIDEEITTKQTTLSERKNNDDKYNTFYGPQTKLGKGHVRTFVSITHSGIPKEVGIIVSKDALNGLPDEGVSLVLPFHHKAMNVVPFKHVYLNWNPHGHPPIPGPYLVPHFDFHFYMISSEERMLISPASPKMNLIPPPPLWPTNYVPTDGGEPQMGKHWINPSGSPEICCGQPFKYTFIHGSYDSKFIFIEPMITRAFLLGNENASKSFSPLKQFVVPNTSYPSTYNIKKGDGDRIISLTNFEKH
ncbi:MAG: hypothetical protein LH478_14960 [Chitinophagaceae bacterium]|nr:hypothetical protein [Chitinophagaceae bacterium]